MYAAPQYVATLDLLAAGQRLRRRRPRAAGLPGQQAPVARGPGPDAGRQPAPKVRTMRSAWTASGKTWCAFWWPRGALHGAGHDHRVRGALPQLRPPVLSCFGPSRAAQHGRACSAGLRNWGSSRMRSGGCSRRSTRMPTIPSGRAPSWRTKLNRRMRLDAGP